MGKRIKNENYYQVSGWMINELKLKGTALDIYAIIYGFSQDGENKFTGSLQYLVDFTGTSKKTVINALKELISKGYITKREYDVNGVKFNEYKVSEIGSVKITPPVKFFPDLDEGGGVKITPNNKVYNNNKYIYIVEEVINHLNKKSGKKYRANTPETVRLITKLLNDNFTVEEIMKVIDTKVAEWKGTKYEQYLRPQTLFGSKFESYLNQKTTPGKKFGCESRDYDFDDLERELGI